MRKARFADEQMAAAIREMDRRGGGQRPSRREMNGDRDAEATEAATRPARRFVALKSQEQLDMQTLHRAGDRLAGERTALINLLRAILLERGLVIAKGHRSSNASSCWAKSKVSRSARDCAC